MYQFSTSGAGLDVQFIQDKRKSPAQCASVQYKSDNTHNEYLDPDLIATIFQFAILVEGDRFCDTKAKAE